MQERDEILDEGLQEGKKQDSSPSFPYFKYSFSYIFLMIGVSFYLSKYQQTINFRRIHSALTGFSMISVSLIFALIKEGISFLYWNVLSDKGRPARTHPFWYSILETSFYFWCTLVLISIAFIFLK